MPIKILAQINFFGPFLTKKDLLRETTSLNPMQQYSKEDLGHFFDLPYESLNNEVLARYVEATTEDTHMHVTPHTEHIFQRMLSPLKSAKKNYALGEYVATIALSGLVGEMLALLLWKINEMSVKGKPVTAKQEKALFGGTFEELKHGRRLGVLEAVEFINQNQLADFTTLKNARNRFLHVWELGRVDEKAEALKAFLCALRLFKQITGVELGDAGTVKVNKQLLKLFKEATSNPSGTAS